MMSFSLVPVRYIVVALVRVIKGERRRMPAPYAVGLATVAVTSSRAANSEVPSFRSTLRTPYVVLPNLPRLLSRNRNWALPACPWPTM